MMLTMTLRWCACSMVMVVKLTHALQRKRGWIAVAVMVGAGTVAFIPRFIVAVDRVRLGDLLGLSDGALLNLDTMFLTTLGVGQFMTLWMLQRRNPNMTEKCACEGQTGA